MKTEESQTNDENGIGKPPGSSKNEKPKNFHQMAEDELLKLRQALRERQKASMV